MCNYRSIGSFRQQTSFPCLAPEFIRGFVLSVVSPAITLAGFVVRLPAARFVIPAHNCHSREIYPLGSGNPRFSLPIAALIILNATEPRQLVPP